MDKVAKDSPARDRHDQGGGAQHGAEDHRQRIQAFGGAGVSDEAGWRATTPRCGTMRLADGPDESMNRHCQT